MDKELKARKLSTDSLRDNWPYEIHHPNGLNGKGTYLFWSEDYRPTDSFHWDGLFKMKRLYTEKSAEGFKLRTHFGEVRNIHNWWNRVAERMVADLNLTEDGKLNFDEFNKARILRDESKRFMDAIHEDIDEIDRKIIQVLKVWYYETIQNVKEIADNEKRAEALDGVPFNLKCFFRDWIRRGVKIDNFPKVIGNRLNHLPYTSDLIKDSTYNGIIHLERKKQSKYEKIAPLLIKWMLYRRAVQLYLKDKRINRINLVNIDIDQLAAERAAKDKSGNGKSKKSNAFVMKIAKQNLNISITDIMEKVTNHPDCPEEIEGAAFNTFKGMVNHFDSKAGNERTTKK